MGGVGTRQLRVLCASTGGAGHVGALAPIALALRAAGHRVHWAVGRDGGDAVASLGFVWTPAGLTTSERRDIAGADLPGVMALPMAQRRGPLFRVMFGNGAVTAAMRRDLGPVLDDLRPDVVVRETAELAAAPMAIARGIPLVTVAFSGTLPEAARPPVLEALRPLWRAEGLDDPTWAGLYGDLYVHPFPPSFGQRPDSGRLRAVRPNVRVPDGDPPPWLTSLGRDRACVYVSAGTERPSTTFPWREVCAALGRCSLDAIVTIGPHVEVDALGSVPTNVRVERFVPQGWVLPRVSAVVSHGGAGTVLGAAACGCSQLVIPLFADQWENGLAVRDAGCGLLVEPDRRGEADIESALRALLDERSYASAAVRVADEIAAMPAADELVPAVEALVAG